MNTASDVSLAFTMAYDFNACTKVWDAFYINLPGGIYGVDTDNQGNFIVAAYDNAGSEYILKHTASGALPTIWKFSIQEDAFNSNRIVQGGIFFGFNDEWISAYSSLQLKTFRHSPISTIDPSQNGKLFDMSSFTALGGKIFAVVTRFNLQVVALR